MKTIFIGSQKLQNLDMLDFAIDEEFVQLLTEYTIMESNIIYFSAGDSKIKEILIQKEPTFSV